MSTILFYKSKLSERFQFPFRRFRFLIAGMAASVMGLALFSLFGVFPQASQGGAQFRVDGNFVLVTSGNSTDVLAYDATSGDFVDVFANGGGLFRPRGFSLRPGFDLLVCNIGGDNVLRYSALTGRFLNVFLTTAGDRPIWLENSLDGNVLVSLSDIDRIDKYDGQTGAFLETFVTLGSGGLDNPAAFLIHTDGNLYVASSESGDSILRYDGTTGAFIDAFVPSGSGGLDNPQDLRFGADGDLYVSSGLSHEIIRYDGQTGAFKEIFVSAGSGGLSIPKGLRFGPDGHLYVCSFDTHEVLKYDGLTGDFLEDFVPAGSGGLDGPIYLDFHTVDTSSNENWTLYE